MEKAITDVGRATAKVEIKRMRMAFWGVTKRLNALVVLLKIKSDA